MTAHNPNLLGQITFYRTYSALKEDFTKETWDEVCTRYENHFIHYYPSEAARIKACVQFMRDRKLVGSMRLLQFAGNAAQKEQLRGYNCSFVNITTVKDLSDILYLSACGVGCGFSVKKRHVDQLPVIVLGQLINHTIPDTREGWADSIKMLYNCPRVVFDYSQIRPAGAPLSTGGAASGPEPLIECHERIRAILLGAVYRKLKPIEVHSIVCSIGDCVVAGGVRRSAMISLFDKDDEEMLVAKAGAWWETNPHFARANNSAHCLRSDTTKEEFDRIYDACIASNAGEPGIAWTNDLDIGGNPCFEIALKSRQLCNLTEVILSNCKDEDDFRQAAIAATILGTYQAGLTDFGYVHPDWSKNCKEDALLGVSISGQAQNWELLNNDRLKTFAGYLKEVNAKVAADIGINRSSRITTTKPSGSTGSALGCSSGIHAVHAPYYLRRIRVNKLDPVCTYLLSIMPPELVEHNPREPNDVIFGCPTKMEGINRHTETAIELLVRMKFIANNWILPGHHKGVNTHNVSVTVSFKPHEVEDIKAWMWANRNDYYGISLLPFNGSSYKYAPYEDLTEEKYKELLALLPKIDLSSIVYRKQDDTRDQTSGCDAGLCEIKRL